MNLTELKSTLRSQYIQRRTIERNQQRQTVGSDIRRDLKRKLKLNADQIEAVVHDLLDDIFGFGPLQRLLDDPQVSEIMVNGPFSIFVEVDGLQREVRSAFDDEKHLIEVLNRLVRRSGQRLDESSPLVDCVIDGIYRLNAAIPPVAINGPLITIRKPRSDIQQIEDLLKRDSLSQQMYHFLWGCIQARKNMIFSGGTGSGKTTLLEVLSEYISDQERLVIIEDIPEIKVRQQNVARLCTRPPNLEGQGEITLRSLFVNSLRMRPTRIILGEIRGPEAFEYLQSLNSGHEGSLAVLHAASPEETLLRLENLTRMSGLNIPAEVIRQQIASGVHILIQIDRFPDGSRKVSRISEVMGLGDDGNVMVQDIFYYDFQGIDAQNQQCQGHYTGCGVTPLVHKVFLQLGLQIPEDIYDFSAE
jgi:pilus assembly protein CpaF